MKKLLLLLLFIALFVWAALADVKGLLIPVTVVLLCFTMGLQNAVITKISGSVVRTTHLTGVITDLGIELGKRVYWNRAEDASLAPVVADRERMATLALLVVSFFLGGVLGAIGFKHFGYLATLPLAGMLLFLSAVPVLDDLRQRG